MKQVTDNQVLKMFEKVNADAIAGYKRVFRSQFIVNEYEMGREWAISFMQQEEKLNLFLHDNLRQQTYCELLWDTFTGKL